MAQSLNALISESNERKVNGKKVRKEICCIRREIINK